MKVVRVVLYSSNARYGISLRVFPHAPLSSKAGIEEEKSQPKEKKLDYALKITRTLAARARERELGENSAVTTCKESRTGASRLRNLDVMY